MRKQNSKIRANVSKVIDKIKELPIRIQLGYLMVIFASFALLFSLFAKQTFGATTTLDGFPIEIATEHESGKDNISTTRAADNKSGTITYPSSQYGYVKYKISGLTPQKVYKVSARITTNANFSFSSDHNEWGAVLGVRSFEDSVSYSKYHYNYSWSDTIREANSYKNVDLYLVANMEGKAEIYIGTPQSGKDDTKIKGMIGYSNLTISTPSSSDITTFTSNNNHIKLIVRTSEYNTLTTNEKNKVSSFVNLADGIYGQLAYLFGAAGNKYLYPFENKPIMLIFTNSISLYQGALAGYPIYFKQTMGGSPSSPTYSKESRFVNYMKTYASTGQIPDTLVHEMSHVFHGVLYSSDNTYQTNINRYAFSMETVAEIGKMYLMGNSQISYSNTSEQQELKAYQDSIGNVSNRTWNDYNFETPFMQTKNSAGNIDWEAFRKTFAWFNNLSNDQVKEYINSDLDRMVWFIKKLSQNASSGYTNILDVLKGKKGNGVQLDSGLLDYIFSHYNFKKHSTYGSVTGDDKIQLGETKKYSWSIKSSDGTAATSSAIVFTSTSPDVATVDDFGYVTAKKKGTTTIQASSIFQSGSGGKTIEVTDDVTVRFVTRYGGKVPDGQSITVPRGTAITLPDCVLEGNTFVGWYTDWDLNTAEYTNFIGGKGSQYTVTKDISLEPKFQYEVHLNYNGAQENGIKYVQCGKTVTQPTDPTWTGYTFTGWYTNSSLTTKYNFSSTTCGEKTLYAGWTPKKYTLTFNMNGGGTAKSVSIAYNTTITPINNPTRTGYTFTGWCEDANCTRKYTFGKMPARSFTLYAGWALQSLQVKFDSRGGSKVSEQTVSYGGYIEEPPDPTVRCFDFVGWYDQNSSSHTRFNFNSTPIYQDMTLYAEWMIQEYNVTFNSKGGSYVPNQVLECDNYVFQPDPPTKKGYVFAGWYTSETYSTKWDFKNQKVSSDVTLYAKWNVENQYTITFDSMGGSFVDSIVATAGESISKPNVTPTKTGYTFAGWYEDQTYQKEYTFNTMPARSFTLYAKWEAIDYTITFNSKGGSSVSPMKKHYEDLIEAPTPPTKTGYDFAGWYEEESYTHLYTFNKMPAKSFTLYAKWEAIDYTITFNSKGGSSVSSMKKHYEDLIEAPTPPTKTGYDFAGWYEEESYTHLYTFNKMPAKSFTLYAKWEAKEYTITFDSNDGDLVPSITAKYGETITKPKNPTREGFEFVGWYKDENLTQLYTFKTMPAENFTLYAKWKSANQSVIHFNSRGGSSVEDIIGDVGSKVEEPNPKPTKKGCSFAGWYRDVNFEEEYQFDVMPDQDITLYAKWIKNLYTITFHSNGGSDVSNITKEYDEKITKPENPTKEGYEFAGWYLSDAMMEEYSFDRMPAENIDLYAKWEAREYTITFYVNGGSDIDVMHVRYGEVITKPKSPTKEGNRFLGWYQDGDLQDEFIFETMPAHDLSLYAKWEVQQYTITFDSNDGTAVDSITAFYGDKVTEPIPPKRDGYGFVGWYLDSDLQKPYTFGIMPAENFTLYAKWRRGIFTVSFNSNGGTPVGNVIVEYGEMISAPAIPQKEGYLFLGWYKDEELKNEFTFNNMIEEDLVLYARWIKNTYTITFQTNGGSLISTIQKKYGDEIEAPKNPTRAGYTFAGWYTDEAFTNMFSFTTMPSHNVFLYAKWNQDHSVPSKTTKYTITFDSMGGSKVVSIVASYQTLLTEPTPPTKAGYTFAGWYQDKKFSKRFMFTTMPKQNITLYARWIDEQYTISFNSNGGSSVDSIVQSYQANIKEPTPPTKAGYTFAGWYIDKDLKKEYVFDKMPKQNIILYAKWEEEVIALPEEDGYIILEELMTSYSPTNYKSQLKLPESYIVKITYNDKELQPTDLIPTGALSRFYIGEKEVAKHINIVMGDTTKDGNINRDDIKEIALYLLNGDGLKEDIQQLAADCKKDKKVRLSDIVTIYEKMEGLR